jgi:repressor LexA
VKPRQRAIIDFIVQHNRENGYSPTFREIGDAVGLKSSSTVCGHIERLEKQGLIKHIPGASRSIVVTTEHPKESEVQVIKRHKGDPSVILWEGRRFVYDPVR